MSNGAGSRYPATGGGSGAPDEPTLPGGPAGWLPPVPEWGPPPPPGAVLSGQADAISPAPASGAAASPAQASLAAAGRLPAGRLPAGRIQAGAAAPAGTLAGGNFVGSRSAPPRPGPSRAAPPRSAPSRAAPSRAAPSRAVPSRGRPGSAARSRRSRPRWPSLPYLLSLAGVAGGLAWTWQGPAAVRGGTFALAGALFLAAFARLVLPAERAGMLASRKRSMDVLTLAVLAASLLAAGLVLPPPS